MGGKTGLFEGFWAKRANGEWRIANREDPPAIRHSLLASPETNPFSAGCPLTFKRLAGVKWLKMF
jgi:hypothetical protein